MKGNFEALGGARQLRVGGSGLLPYRLSQGPTLSANSPGLDGRPVSRTDARPSDTRSSNIRTCRGNTYSYSRGRQGEEGAYYE
jgi:hypothetical protein